MKNEQIPIPIPTVNTRTRRIPVYQYTVRSKKKMSNIRVDSKRLINAKMMLARHTCPCRAVS
jgi:hypothetical protein